MKSTKAEQATAKQRGRPRGSLVKARTPSQSPNEYRCVLVQRSQKRLFAISKTRVGLSASQGLAQPAVSCYDFVHGRSLSWVGLSHVCDKRREEV
jgi:hypothetical protein